VVSLFLVFISQLFVAAGKRDRTIGIERSSSMLRSKGLYVASAVVVAALGFAFISQVFAQESRPARGGRGNFDPAQFQADRDKQMQDRLGVTADEWKVLQPKIDKVRTAQRDARGGGMFGMGGPGQGGRGNRGTRGGAPAAGGDTPAQPDNAPAQSEVQKASTALGKVLENKDAKPEDIKAALTTFRDAKVKAKTELEKAQKDLKEVLTLKQEAQFVMMGMLE
jgi:Spy/CpxP family protein refolding chaperone